MGGKGRRRREKNFKAAHGGSSRLPPPPNPSQVDALPSKLRQLISYTSHASDKADQKKRKIGDGYDDSGKKGFFENVVKEEGSRKEDSHDEIVNGDKSNENRKKKKRKREQVKDLRFEAEMEFASSSKRKDRKKKYLEAKKTKKKKGVSKDDEDFLPRHEKIEFGDVVKAPPKLVIPKAFKGSQNVSQERLRLQAIESYRNRKKWSARLGLHVPSPATASPSL